jgi:hypothetical protein
VSDHVCTNESVGKRLAPGRRLRASILEMMLLVAALAVSFCWPGLSVPVGLLFLYALAQRRDILRRQTRVAFGQIALAMYLPPAVGLLLVPREEWGYYLEHFSLMPTFIPWGFIVVNLLWFFRFNSPLFPVAIVILSMIVPLAAIVGLGVVPRRDINWRIACPSIAAAIIGLTLPWWFTSRQNTVAIVVLSTIPPLCLTVGLGVVARRGRAWRIACLIIAEAMSAASTLLTWLVLHMGA